MNQAGKRDLHKQIPGQLCPLLSTFCAGRFYTQCFHSAHQQHQGPGSCFLIRKLRPREMIASEMAPWAFSKHKGSLVTSHC